MKELTRRKQWKKESNNQKESRLEGLTRNHKKVLSPIANLVQNHTCQVYNNHLLKTKDMYQPWKAHIQE